MNVSSLPVATKTSKTERTKRKIILYLYWTEQNVIGDILVFEDK